MYVSAFEEMVTEPEQWARGLAAFLGILPGSDGSGSSTASTARRSSSSTGGRSSRNGSSSSGGPSRGAGTERGPAAAVGAAASADAKAAAGATARQQQAQWVHLTTVAAALRKQARV